MLIFFKILGSFLSESGPVLSLLHIKHMIVEFWESCGVFGLFFSLAYMIRACLCIYHERVLGWFHYRMKLKPSHLSVCKRWVCR